MKKFKLLQSLPGVFKGAISHYDEDADCYYFGNFQDLSGAMQFFTEEELLKYDIWFEEIPDISKTAIEDCPESYILTLQQQIHAIAKKKGFWDYDDEPTNLDPEIINSKLMLIVTEVAEACEALRIGDYQLLGEWRNGTFDDELADILIRVLDLAEAMQIDMQWQIEKKMEYNKNRGEKHGKSF